MGGDGGVRLGGGGGGGGGQGTRRPNMNGLGPADNPRPSRRRHREGSWPALSASELSGSPGSVGLLPVAERDVRLPHRGGSDGVSYALHMYRIVSPL